MILVSAFAVAFGIASCATQVYATPAASKFPPYQRPGKGDARSACPGINALANHGWLPHNGRNITYDMLLQAVRSVFAFDLPPSEPGFAINVFHSAISDPANVALHPENTTFDMDAVNTHNGPIEFDGSLSRKDDFFGSPVPFDHPTWDTQWRLMEEEQKASNSTRDVFDLGVASRARARHVLIKSQAGNPEFLFTEGTRNNSAGTTALYMMVLGGMTKAVRKDWLRAFFGMF
ncbi:Chloroperoxidase [Diaporthe sp. PMI_573]|nr:Chloroperoxidase [Diaporthaceae sp. PMI_573]